MSSLFWVDIERLSEERKRMLVYADSPEDAERIAADEGLACEESEDILIYGEWENEVTDVLADAEEVAIDDLDDDEREIAEQKLVELRAETETNYLEALTAAGWECLVDSGRPFGKGWFRVRVRPYEDGMFTFGFGKTVEAAVRDAANYSPVVAALIGLTHEEVNA